MRLASESVVTIGAASPIVLRPTLRAATSLEQRYGGFDRLLEAIADGSISTMRDIIEASSNRTDMLATLQGVPLADVLSELIDKLATHVLLLAGVDPAAETKPQSGKPITFAEYHSKLYRIGTGWLGWSPAQAWNATPAEILEAYSGHLEMLRAIHGGAEPEPGASSVPDNAPIDRAGLNKLKAMSGAA